MARFTKAALEKIEAMERREYQKRARLSRAASLATRDRSLAGLLDADYRIAKYEAEARMK